MTQNEPDILTSTDIRAVVPKLEEWLREPLPGRESQLRMSSNLRLRELMRHQTPPDAVPSSVLILLFPAADGIRTVFIKRPRYDGVHSGQISLPGGKAEPGDPDTGYTALRETEEEIGVPAGEITLIGKLSELYIPPSNFLVTPWIGYVTFTPVFKPDPSEVDGLLEALIRDLADDRNVKEVLISVHGMELKAPAFVMHGEVIWGATAMILSEFREVIGKRNR